MKTKVLIVDDHPFTRVGIRSILSAVSSIDIIGEARDGLEALELTREKKPDVVLMDITMPNLSGIDATKEIVSKNPEVKVVALSIHAGDKFVKGMLDSGAVAYLLKEEATDELIKAIDKISKGDIYLSSGVTRAALKPKTEYDIITKRVLKTKLMRPSVFQYLVRSRINDKLENNLSKPLTLISAGTGYGKSVAVSQWLETSKRLYAWISLDEEHNDLRIFLSYIVAALQRILPGSMRETADAISGTELPNQKTIAYVLLGELCEIEEEVILVLDDYHVIRNDKVHYILDEWLKFPPPNIHISLVTRRDPPLEINSLRLAGRMTEIRMDELSFTNEEVQQLFKLVVNIELGEHAIEVLQSKTEGWIIALSLASMAIKRGADLDEFMKKFEGKLKTSSEYLIAEVLSSQSAEIQESLLFSSILNRFCADILDDIFLADTNLTGSQFINHLLSDNMLVIDLDIEGIWYRYHHLFQELLKAQLSTKLTRDKIAQLHIMASKWFEEHGYLEEAMDHASNANKPERAAEIVKSHRLSILDKNQYDLLERLQRKIPMTLIKSDAKLILVESYIQFNHGNFVRLGELEEKMNMLAQEAGREDLMDGEYYFFIGFVSLFLKGDLPGALKSFDLGLETVPESASEPRGLLEAHVFIFRQFTGVYEDLKRMFAELINQNLAPARKARVYQGFLAASLDEANMDEVRIHSPTAITFARESGMKDALGLLLYLQASMLIRTGYRDKAIDLFYEVLENRYYIHSRIVTDSLGSLILIYTLKNEKEKARDVLKLLEDFVSGLEDFHKTFLWSTKLRLCMINQDRKALREYLNENKPGVLDLVLWINVPEITYARALIFEGSPKNLERAEQELSSLEATTAAMHNRLHHFEVTFLQAKLYNEKGDTHEAKKALIKSLDVAREEDLVEYYLEFGETFETLTKLLTPADGYDDFIARVLDEIKNLRSDLELEQVQDVNQEEKKKHNILTSREQDVLQCISEGMGNIEIAEKLFNSPETVKKHISNMFLKFNVKNRLSLVIQARELGLLEEDQEG